MISQPLLRLTHNTPNIDREMLFSTVRLFDVRTYVENGGTEVRMWGSDRGDKVMSLHGLRGSAEKIKRTTGDGGQSTFLKFNPIGYGLIHWRFSCGRLLNNQDGTQRQQKYNIRIYRSRDSCATIPTNLNLTELLHTSARSPPFRSGQLIA